MFEGRIGMSYNNLFLRIIEHQSSYSSLAFTLYTGNNGMLVSNCITHKHMFIQVMKQKRMVTHQFYTLPVEEKYIQFCPSFDLKYFTTIECNLYDVMCRIADLV